MPRSGEKFINAVGVEVVAHGGATPTPSVIATPPKMRTDRTGELLLDIYGRVYDTAVPVFLYASNDMVIDRLAFTTASRAGTFAGTLVTLASLQAYADEIGYVFPAEEIDFAPSWWLDMNPLWKPYLITFGPPSAPRDYMWTLELAEAP